MDLRIIIRKSIAKRKMNKIALIAFFFICSIAIVQCNIFKNVIDDGVYALIDSNLKDEYKDNPKKAECMIEDFRRNRIADKFYTVDIITNTEKLQRELQPFIDEANLKCTVISFFQSPWGICILVLLASLIAIAFIRCLVRCICR